MTAKLSKRKIPARPSRSSWRLGRATLHHALLSYLFGAVLPGLVINVVATLLK